MAQLSLRIMMYCLDLKKGRKKHFDYNKEFNTKLFIVSEALCRSRGFSVERETYPLRLLFPRELYREQFKKMFEKGEKI